MPRSARKKSESGIYHVMTRGIDRQVIFQDEEDCEKMLFVLNDCKEISGFELYAYCLMGNHIHLLIKTCREDLDKIFKRIGVRYVYWYNQKYVRTGPLFQDRYKSEPVEDDTYFLTVLRYIHQNPVKAGLCQKAEEYRWSSYQDYLSGDGITDTDFALSLFDDDIAKFRGFSEYSEKEDDTACLDMEEVSRRLTDREAQDIIKKLCKVKSTTEIQTFEPAKRDKMISKLKGRGLSIRQISRLTGVSFGIVRKI